jgi:hypothetical protein
MSDKKLPKEHPRKTKELEHVRQGLIMADLTAIGMVTLGVVKPSLGKLLSGALVAPSVASDPNWFLVVGGAAAYLTIRLAKSQFIKDENKIFREGVDNQVRAPEYLKFCGSLASSSAYQSSNELMDKLERFTKKSTAPRDFFDNKALNKNSVNIVHMLAALGEDNSRYAQRLKADPGFADRAVQKIFANSAMLMKIMTPNQGNLYQFSETVRKSLGRDAEYLLKNYKDYNAGKTEWRGLTASARSDATANAQEANLHHHFAYLAASGFSASLSGALTPSAANALIDQLALFRPLTKSSSPGTPLYRTAELASKMAGELRTLTRRDKEYTFHQLDFFHLNRQKAYHEGPVKITSDDPSVMRAKASLLPWVKDTKLKPVQQLFVESLFKKLTDSAEKEIISKKYTDSDFYQGLPSEISKTRLSDMGMLPGEGLKGLTPGKAAEAVVDRVKGRVANAVLTGTADHDTDTRKSPQQSAGRRWGFNR